MPFIDLNNTAPSGFPSPSGTASPQPAAGGNSSMITATPIAADNPVTVNPLSTPATPISGGPTIDIAQDPTYANTDSKVEVNLSEDLGAIDSTALSPSKTLDMPQMNDLGTVDLNVADLNSDAIAEEETNTSGIDVLTPTAQDGVNVSISDDGVKTITGPDPAFTPMPTAVEPTPLSSNPLVSTEAPVMTPEPIAPIMPTLEPVVSVTPAAPISEAAPVSEPIAPIVETDMPVAAVVPATPIDVPVVATTPPSPITTDQQGVQFAQQNGQAENVSTSSSEVNIKVSTDETAIPEGDLPATTTLEELITMATGQKASDIHFAMGYPVMFRVDGALKPITKILSKEQAEGFVGVLLSDAQKVIYEKDKEIDLSFTSQAGARLRVNLFTERENPAGALRLISSKIRTIKELGLPEVLFKIIEEPYGLVLVVGPTGSGKSTTLAGMINYINTTRQEHILTIEDPIEYVYPRSMSLVNQRELNADTPSWQRALKSALREDPNVVLVGEMRDLDTIESTITVAETGHLTFATLHTNSAAQSIDRMIDVFPEGAKGQIRAQLANVLVAVVSQRLIPVQSGGRRAALEIMLGSVAVRNAIREGKTYQIDNIIQTSGDIGMITLEKSLAQMVKDGLITKDQALNNTSKPEELESLLSKI
jgi:twitching motility protein PilT